MCLHFDLPSSWGQKAGVPQWGVGVQVLNRTVPSTSHKGIACVQPPLPSYTQAIGGGLQIKKWNGPIPVSTPVNFINK